MRCKRQRKWIDRSDPVREEPGFYKGLRGRPLVEARALRITHLGAPASPATPDRCWHPTWSETSLKQLARGEPSIDVKRNQADPVLAAEPSTPLPARAGSQ